MSRWSWAKDPLKAAQATEQKQRAKDEAHAQAVANLRELLQADEGRNAGQQLVQGGELSRPEDITSDAYLTKWLVAREWDAQHTYTCIINHAQWRAHTMPCGYIDEAWIQQPLADDKTFIQGRDHNGRAVAIVQVCKHLTKASDLHSMRLYTCYVINALVALADPVKNPGRRLVVMFDLSNASTANIDVGCLLMILGLLNQHYVETLDCMLFYNPPLVFWGIWSGLKRLLPEATRTKIKFIHPAQAEGLQALIPPEVLPQQYGGAAELLSLPQAIRKFKLPPYPHLPQAEGIAAAAAQPPLSPSEQQEDAADTAAAAAVFNDAVAEDAVAAIEQECSLEQQLSAVLKVEA